MKINCRCGAPMIETPDGPARWVCSEVSRGCEYVDRDGVRRIVFDGRAVSKKSGAVTSP